MKDVQIIKTDKEKLIDFMNWLYENWEHKRYATPPMLVDYYIESINDNKDSS